GKPATRLNYATARCPTGVALVRFDRVSRVRDHESFVERLLRELRDPSWNGRSHGTRRGWCRSATRRPASGGALSGRVAVFYSPPFPRGATSSDMLSVMFHVSTKNFLPFFVVYLALGAATGALSAVLSFAIFGTVFVGGGFGGVPPTSFPTGNFGLILIDAIATFVVSAILTSIVTGAMTEYAIRRYRGEPMAVEQALRRGLARFPSILGANILLGLILFGLVTIPLLLIAVALLAGLSGATGTIALLCGGLILFVVLGVLAIFLYVSLVLYAPAIMMENASAVGGLSRSWRMTRGHRWSLLGSILIVSILGGVIGAAISVPLGFAASAGGPNRSAPSLGTSSGPMRS